MSTSIEIQSGLLKEAASFSDTHRSSSRAERGRCLPNTAETRELESLRRYDDHLERMVQEQANSISQLEHQLEDVAVTQREIVPLMTRMVQSLSRFIEFDLPFLIEERRQRAAGLAEIIDSPAISVAEKYRRILEAYRIEVEYGRSVEAYRDSLATPEGERTVEFLRVGRVVFIYRTLDGAETGIWDRKAGTWSKLPDDYQLALNKAFRVARKQAAPDLLQLPVFSPEPVL